MSALDRLRLHFSRNPDRELRRVRREFWATPQRTERIAKPRRLRGRPVLVPVMGLLAALMLYWGLASALPETVALELGRAERPAAFFPNCDAARAAGAAPMQRGEPGYRSQLDSDGDGWACEPWQGR